jgi:DNA-directed RNA polymerase subunit RPC12/RpoP
VPKDNRTWALEDHLCRGCGGRILRCVKGNGITGGGNPIYKCADCGKATASMGPWDLCWCGYAQRMSPHLTAYRCLPYSILDTRPELRQAFLMCGCDPARGEVGIVLEKSLQATPGTSPSGPASS